MDPLATAACFSDARPGASLPAPQPGVRQPGMPVVYSVQIQPVGSVPTEFFALPPQIRNSVKFPEKTSLLLAAETGRISTVRTLLAHGAHVDLADSYQETALIIAATRGYIGIVRTLLEAGASVNHRSDNGWTALILAAKRGRTAIVKMLIRAGAGIDQAADCGGTPLMFAIENKRPLTVDALVQAGADVNLVDRNGKTALMIAHDLGLADIAQVLRKAGATDMPPPEKSSLF